MSTEILQLRVWAENTLQNNIPANDNSLRLEALLRPCLGIENEPDVTDPPYYRDGDVWIVGDTPAGVFTTFNENDIAIHRLGNWYAWQPVTGLRTVVAGVRKVFDGAEWIDDPSIGGGGGSDVLDVQTPTNASGTVTLDFDSKSRYVGEITLGANVTTLAFSNLPGAGKYAEYELHITQDPTTPRTFSIPASHKALGGSATAIAASVNVVTVLTASTVDNGTTWRYAMQESA